MKALFFVENGIDRSVRNVTKSGIFAEENRLDRSVYSANENVAQFIMFSEAELQQTAFCRTRRHSSFSGSWLRPAA
jgi:hypothetical protein